MAHASAAGRRSGQAGVPFRAGMVSLCAVLVLAILAAAAWSIRERRGAAYDAAERQTTALGIALVEQTTRAIEAVDAALRELAGEVSAEGIDQSEALASRFGTADVHRRLRDLKTSLRQLAAISFVDGDGHLLNDSLAWPPNPIDLSQSEFFVALRAAPSSILYIGRPIEHPATGTWTLDLARRLEATGGRFIGVALATVELSHFETLYRAIVQDKDQVVALRRRDGVLLARYPLGSYREGDLPQDAPLSELLARGTTVTGWVGPTNADGVYRLRAVRPLPDYPLAIVVSEALAEIARQWRPYAVVVAGGGAILAALLILATAMLLRESKRRDFYADALRRERDGLERLVAKRTMALALSEERHRDVAELSSDWFWEIDAAGRFVFVSNRFEQVTGVAAAKILGRSFDEIGEIATISSEGRQELRQAIATRSPFANLCLSVMLPDGGTRQWLNSGKPFFDAQGGDFAGFRGTGTDVTAVIERELALTRALQRGKAAEKEAEAARSRLLEAIKVIPTGFALWDADDRLVLCNDRMRELYGKGGDLIVPGVRFEDLVRAIAARGQFVLGDQDLEAWVAERVARHRAPGGSRFEQPLADGRWVLAEERPTADGGVVGIRIDVTEEHQRERVEHERQKLAALGQLAGGVAHEINNLLQPVLALPPVVRDRLPAEDAESRADLTEIVDSARRMREIVRNVLLFARRQDPVLVPLDLAAELKSILAFVGGLLPPTVTLRQLPPATRDRPMAAVNQTQLTQVLTNLVVNAAQAMADHGTVTVTLRNERPSAVAAAALGLDPGRLYLALDVADTGCGMDAEVRKHIFEPFFTTKPVGQGTGLGLSVVYGILRSWQGVIAVESAPGRGTTFTLYIPAVEGAAADVSHTAESAA